MAEEPKLNETLFRFDAYDVLGYLVPGATVAYGVYLYGMLFSTMDVRHLETFVPDVIDSLEDWPRLVALVFFGTFLVYLIGHVTALVSSSLFDKLVVERTLGYPFERLFCRVYDDKEIARLWYARRSKLFYKAILVVLVALAITCFTEHNIARKVLTYSFAVLVGVKLIFTALSLKDMRDPSFLRPEHTWQRRWAGHLWIVFRYPLLVLYGVYDLALLTVLSFLFRMQKPFSLRFQRAFQERFETVFEIPLEEAGTNIYWLCYIYLCQNDRDSARIVQHWLNLYAFARNLCAAFLVLCIYGLVVAEITTVDAKLSTAWVATTGLIAFLFFLRYYYIYYNYYSKYIFRAFLVFRPRLVAPSITRVS